MSANDDVIHVIDRTALIENLLNQAIEKYCSPRKEAFPLFWSVILDSSIIELGAKIKVALAIAQETGFKLKDDPLHKLLSYRNAFAHHAVDAHPVLFVAKDPEKDEMRYMLHTISNSGRIRQISRNEALKEFDTCYDQAKQSLVEFCKAIVANVESEKDGAI
jgi:hypothetical protein